MIVKRKIGRRMTRDKMFVKRSREIGCENYGAGKSRQYDTGIMDSIRGA